MRAKAQLTMPAFPVPILSFFCPPSIHPCTHTPCQSFIVKLARLKKITVLETMGAPRVCVLLLVRRREMSERSEQPPEGPAVLVWGPITRAPSAGRGGVAQTVRGLRLPPGIPVADVLYGGAVRGDVPRWGPCSALLLQRVRVLQRL